MNRMFALFGGTVVAAGLAVAAFAHDGVDHSKGGKKPAIAEAGEGTKPVTITGELIDTACFTASEGDAKGKEHAECAQKCMATGIPAGILPEGNTDAKALMFLLTNPVPLAPYAAQTIKVEGTAHPGTHAFDIKKAFVKDGANWKEVQLKDEHHKMSGGEAKDDDGHKDHKH